MTTLPIPTPAELEAAMARKRAFLRRQNRALTPEARLEKFWHLQNRVMEQLRASPDAWQRFWQRNLKKRAISWHEP